MVGEVNQSKPLLKRYRKVYSSTLSLGLGALMHFDKLSKDKPLVARVGISFVSEAKACASAEEEVPTFDFDGTKAAAKITWEETLDTIYVDGESYDDKVLFYSSVSLVQLFALESHTY